MSEGVSEAVGVSSGCRVSFDVVDHVFVVVCGSGPHDFVSCKLSYLLLHVLCAGGG